MPTKVRLTGQSHQYQLDGREGFDCTEGRAGRGSDLEVRPAVPPPERGSNNALRHSSVTGKTQGQTPQILCESPSEPLYKGGIFWLLPLKFISQESLGKLEIRDLRSRCEEIAQNS